MLRGSGTGVALGVEVVADGGVVGAVEPAVPVAGRVPLPGAGMGEGISGLPVAAGGSEDAPGLGRWNPGGGVALGLIAPLDGFTAGGRAKGGAAEVAPPLEVTGVGVPADCTGMGEERCEGVSWARRPPGTSLAGASSGSGWGGICA